MAEPSGHGGNRAASIGEALARRVREQPYPMLALALMAGYVAGGGLFTPLTRPLARAAMGALLVPGVRERVRGWTDGLEEASAAGT